MLEYIEFFRGGSQIYDESDDQLFPWVTAMSLCPISKMKNAMLLRQIAARRIGSVWLLYCCCSV